MHNYCQSCIYKIIYIYIKNQLTQLQVQDCFKQIIAKMTMINKQMMQQKLDMILIQTPMRNQVISNCSFQNANEKVVEDLKKLYESNFYQEINVHYGVRSRMQENLTQKIYKRRKQIIQRKIQLELAYINKIRRVESESDMQKIQKQYNQNMEKVKIRQKQFDPTQFIPCIYIETIRKRSAYGKLFQEFDRKGVAMLKATIGYRAPFTLLDKMEFTMETPPFQYFRKRNYYQFSINWRNPTNYLKGSNLFAGLTASSGLIFKGIDQKKLSANFGLQKEDNRIQLQTIKRYPSLHQRLDQYCSKGYHLPTSKISVKFDRTLKDTIERGSIMTGQLKQAKLQSTIPFISHAQFVKGQYNFRKYYDIYNFSEHFKNKQLKLFFQNSSLQTNFNLKAFAMKNNFVSDFIENIQVRGFENDRKPNQSVLQLKCSIKLNNYNYPLFGGIGIIPFIYAQGGLSIERNIKKPHALGSAGLGVSYQLGKNLQLQLLYSLFQAQNRPKREPINFQIRIGLLD